MLVPSLLLLLSTASLCRAQTTDWSAVAFPQTAIPLNATRWSGHFRSTGRAYNATLAAFHPANFSIVLPPNGCVDHSTTSATARAAGCSYATNAGFFDFPPHAACEGNLVLDGQLQQFTSSARTNVGRNATHFLVGYASNGTVEDVAPTFLVSGLGWLVRGGASYVADCREFSPGPPPSFVTEWAPRTGAGVRADGTALLLAIDGIEGTSAAAGADLEEFADLFIEMGAVHAMNLDGGGSTTAVLNGSVFNSPHCADTWTVCERNVTSVTCVS